jgi:dephospho-CoA kinase
VLTADGDLDRDRLGRIVFADPAARRRLEGITWPLVGARVADVLATAPADVIVVYDVPLLVESGGADSYDVIVVVATDPQTQLDRLETTRGMSRADAQARIAAQAPLADKLAVADFVLHNDGPLESLDSQVQTLWAYLCDRAGQRIPDRPNGRN